MFLTQKNIIFDVYSPRGHSRDASDCWGRKCFPHPLKSTLEQRLVGVLALVDFQLLLGLLTTFETTCILFCWVYMFAFKMFLKVLFCVEFLITAASCTKDFLRV